MAVARSARRLASALASVAALAALPATASGAQAWSEIVLDQGSHVGMDRAGLVATSVDGHAGADRGTLRLAPGVHTLVLQWNPKGSFSRTPGHVLRLDAKPCKRYVVVARFPFSSSASTSSWQPVVLKTEAISGCLPSGAPPAAPGPTSRRPAY